jgi:acyl dehydratase
MALSEGQTKCHSLPLRNQPFVASRRMAGAYDDGSARQMPPKQAAALTPLSGSRRMPRMADFPRVYFEDLTEGEEFTSLGRTITEADIVNLAAFMGWYDPLHTDAEATKDGPFGGRVAQGLVGLVLSNGLTNGCIPSHRGLAAIVAFLGISEWNFRGPIRIGDTIHVVVRVIEKRPTKSPGRGVVVFAHAVVNQKGETVQDGRKTYLIQTRPAS